MIHVSHLTKAYGPRTAVNDISFDVQKGEIVGFLGPNGAGKSTTMKMITGFMPATSGEISVAGHDVFSDPIEVKRNVGFLPETPPLYFEMTVEDYLKFAAQLHQVPSNQLETAVNVAIDRTGLGDVRHRLIGNLSKGYKQRVGLAQALVHRPKVLILDEPTVGLDPKQIIEIRSLIKELAGEHTVILSSHILPEVTATCQRIIVINKGRIVAEDTLEQLTTRLNKGQIFQMLVRNPSAPGIEALKRVQGVQSIAAAQGKLTIQIQPGANEIRDQLIEAAVAQKLGVLEFSPERLSLEDIFMQLTTDENAAEKGARS